jgi:hypothetical protein
MSAGWKITSSRTEWGARPAQKEHFIVAISDPSAAAAALRNSREDLVDADITVVSEATPDDLNWLEASTGEIFSVVMML